MKYGFDYDEYNKFEKSLSAVEERIIRDQFQIVADGNDFAYNKSSPELQEAFWLFRHGWICHALALR